MDLHATHNLMVSPRLHIISRNLKLFFRYIYFVITAISLVSLKGRDNVFLRLPDNMPGTASLKVEFLCTYPDFILTIHI